MAGKEQAAVAKRYTNDPDAYELYLKGQEEDDGPLKLALYEQAIQKDPAFALAYAKIADRYNSSGYSGEKEYFLKAKEMAQKALEIDSTLAEAHAEMAWYSMYNDWDWEAAEQALQRAVTHNPGYAKAYRYYRDYYLIMGDVERAIEMVERAHAVDPLSQDAAI